MLGWMACAYAQLSTFRHNWLALFLPVKKLLCRRREEREGGRVLTVAAVSLGYGLKVGKMACVLRPAQHLLTPLASRFLCW